MSAIWAVYRTQSHRDGPIGLYETRELAEQGAAQWMAGLPDLRGFSLPPLERREAPAWAEAWQAGPFWFLRFAGEGG